MAPNASPSNERSLSIRMQVAGSALLKAHFRRLSNAIESYMQVAGEGLCIPSTKLREAVDESTTMRPLQKFLVSVMHLIVVATRISQQAFLLDGKTGRILWPSTQYLKASWFI